MSPGEVTRDFYRKQGADAERERIIELLNKMTIKVCNCYECEAIREAIASIKGENK